MNSQLLGILRCPLDRTPLVEVSETLLAQLNRSIRAGRVKNLSGKQLEATVEGGLVRAAGDVLYPIIDGIPLLLRDEAIALNQAGIQSSD